jgi:hypothetical protein
MPHKNRDEKNRLEGGFLYAGFGEAKACASLADTLVLTENMHI